MRLAYLALAVALAARLSLGLSRTEKRQLEGDGRCTFGEVKTELGEDERLDTTGTYLILDPIQCNGTLVSWHSCFFFGSSMSELTRYQYTVGIFRLNDKNVYVFQGGSNSNLFVDRSTNTMDNDCVNQFANPPVPVLIGDLVGLRIQRCSTEGSGTTCPGYPNLNSSLSGNMVFYSNTDGTAFPLTAVRNTNNHVPVSINLRASILPDGGGCSSGEVKTELSADERLDTTGTYLILDPIQCNGTLVSWHSCFFFGSSLSELTRYQYTVGIFGINDGNVVFQGGSDSNLFVEKSNNTVDNGYDCVNQFANPPVPVLSGDLVGLRIQSGCSTENVTTCPGHPNLNSSLSGNMVFYSNKDRTAFRLNAVRNTNNHVPVSINLRASILPDVQPTSNPQPVVSASTQSVTSPVPTTQPTTTEAVGSSSPVPSQPPTTSSTPSQTIMPSTTPAVLPDPSPTTQTGTGTSAPTPYPPDDRVCSFGGVKTELSEDERLDTTGTYLILDPIQCNGTLVSWYSCFFYDSAMTSGQIRYRFSVGIFRLINENTYVFQQGTNSSLIVRGNDGNMDNGYGCDNQAANPPVPVLSGDLVGLRIQGRCRTANGGTTCPGYPNLNSGLNGNMVFYYPRTDQTEFPLSAVRNTNNHVPVSINIRASILPGNQATGSHGTATIPPATSNVPGMDNSEPGGQSGSERTIRPGEIAGIVIGLVALATVILILLLLVVFFHRKGSRQQKAEVDQKAVTSIQRESEATDSTRAEFQVSYSAFGDKVDMQWENNPRNGATLEKKTGRKKFPLRSYSSSNMYSLLGPDTDLTSAPAFDEPHYEFQQSFEESAQSGLQSPHNITSSTTAETSECGGGGMQVADYLEPARREEEDDPYWEPSSREDELRIQLAQLRVAEIPRQDIQTHEHLGSGQFGVVSRALWHHSEAGGAPQQLEVAVKILPLESAEDERVKFLQEATIMGQFYHPNVLKILGVITTEEPLGIVMEMMHQGDLRLHLHSLRPQSVDSLAELELPALLLSFCRQIAAGMSYLAGKSFVHRDLAARNILVSSSNVCKIADFGLSRLLQDEDHYTSHGGKVPVKWTAPEAVTYRKYSTASDVWSYSILLYEIWALGQKPYQQWTNSEALQKVLRGYRLPPPPGCPRVVYKLMLECWNPIPESRPSFFDILLVLQQPDFQILRWSPEDERTCSREARTLGGDLDSGRELYQEMQGLYLSQNNPTHSTF